MIVDYISSGKPKVDRRRPDVSRAGARRRATSSWRRRDHERSVRQELADAVKRAGNVIMLADAVDAGLDNGEFDAEDWPAPPYRLGPAIEERPVITLPYPALSSASAGSGA